MRVKSLYNGEELKIARAIGYSGDEVTWESQREQAAYMGGKSASWCIQFPEIKIGDWSGIRDQVTLVLCDS
jgi:hypothetical protein